MNKLKYFQFPIMLLKDIHINYDAAMEDIITFSAVNFALKQEIKTDDAARQLVYNHIRGGGLSEAMDAFGNSKINYFGDEKYIDDIEIDSDLDYAFFTDGNHNEVMPEVVKTLNNDPELMRLAVLNCQLSKIDKFFGITGVTVEDKYRRYTKILKRVEQHEARFGKDPYPTLLKELFFDFKETPDPLLFSFYMAVRSLEGQNKLVATNKTTVIMRMMGAKSKDVLETFLKDKKIKQLHTDLTGTDKKLRYHFDKLIYSLLSRGLLKSKIGFERRIYLSTHIKGEELKGEIISLLEKHKQRKNEKKYRNEIKKILDVA